MLDTGCAALLQNETGCTALLEDDADCTEATTPLYIYAGCSALPVM